MIEDALKSARSLHRFILAASLLTILFALSLVPPGPRIALRDTIRNLACADFLAYDEFTREKVDLHISTRRVSVSRWLADTFGTNSLIEGLDSLAERITKPLLVSKFEVKGTTLSDPKNTTLNQLRSPALMQRLSRNIGVVEVDFAMASQQLEALLGPYAERQVRIALEVQDAEDADWVNRARGFEGTRLFSVPKWPDLPDWNRYGLPPTFRFPLSFTALVNYRQLDGSAFIDWVNSVGDMGEVVSVTFAGLAFADGAYWKVSPEQRGQTLEQLQANLTADISAADPRRQRVSILGAQVPGVLVVVASPLVLLMLSYSLAMHTMHLRRFVADNVDELEKFAWLPLTLRTNISWALATTSSVVVVPSVSLWFLKGRLTEFEGIDWSLGLIAMTVARVGIVVFGLVSLYSILKIRLELPRFRGRF